MQINKIKKGIIIFGQILFFVLFVIACGTNKKIVENKNSNVSDTIVDTAKTNTQPPLKLGYPGVDYSKATLEKREAPNRVKELLPGINFFVRSVPKKKRGTTGNPFSDELVAQYNDLEYMMPAEIGELFTSIDKELKEKEIFELLIYLKFWNEYIRYERAEWGSREKVDSNSEIKIKKIRYKEFVRNTLKHYVLVSFTYKDIEYEAGFRRFYENTINVIEIYKNQVSHSASSFNIKLKNN